MWLVEKGRTVVAFADASAFDSLRTLRMTAKTNNHQSKCGLSTAPPAMRLREAPLRMTPHQLLMAIEMLLARR